MRAALGVAVVLAALAAVALLGAGRVLVVADPLRRAPTRSSSSRAPSPTARSKPPTSIAPASLPAWS